MAEIKTKEDDRPVIEITRIAIREKYGHFSPPRYSTRQKWIYVHPEKGEQDCYPNERYRTFNKFVARIKEKFGNTFQYKVDNSKPYVHYI